MSAVNGNGRVTLKVSQDAPGVPTAPDAERAVLGSIMIDPDALARVRVILEPGDFFDDQHRAVYQAILDLHKAGRPWDMVTLYAALEGHVTDSALSSLLIGVPTALHAEHYAAQVRRARVQRDVIQAAQALAGGAYQGGDDLPCALATARAALAQAERLMLDGGDGLGLRASLDYYLDLLEKREREKNLPKLELPWREFGMLDMPYLDAGTLVGILAEPGVGKTAFMENCAEAWARDGWRVAFFHLELSTQMMLDRRMQRHSGVPIKRLQLGGHLEESDYVRILEAGARIGRWAGNIQYVHCPGWPMARIVAAAQKFHDTGGVDVVVVDYFNKVGFLQRGDMNAAQSRGQDIEEFKTALEVNGWVGLMAAQFDKASKSARRRTLGDARDTGELQDKSNVGIVIDRPYEGLESNDRSQSANVIIDKCNAGRTGSIPMFYRGDRLAFYPVSGKAEIA